MEDWTNLIFSGSISFQKKAQRVYQYQYEYNPVYQRFCEALKVDKINAPDEYPLLPIQAFKDTNVVTDYSKFKIQNSTLKFKSSGTESMQHSKHYVSNSEIYHQSILKGFRQFYDLDTAVIWGYTPGYADNPNSSLTYMIKKLIEQDKTQLSRFLPLNKPLIAEEIIEISESGKQLIIFGAAFGLIDLVEQSNIKLSSNSIVIETGGMKTHRRQMNREQIQRKLANGFDLDKSRIHSEYGMCELLSQAYATGGKWFRSVPWMQVSIRNPDDPQQILPPFQEGLIGVIDLANVHSCSFLLTGDRGITDKQGRFQVLGRWNPRDLRGCNFLIDED